MKTLPTQFTDRGFQFNQLRRRGNVAVFSRTKGKVTHFETVIVDSHQGFQIKGKQIEPSEFYPSSEQWGTKGFTFNDQDAALAKASALELV